MQSEHRASLAVNVRVRRPGYFYPASASMGPNRRLSRQLGPIGADTGQGEFQYKKGVVPYGLESPDLIANHFIHAILTQ
jgi:hypothetical protein